MNRREKYRIELINWFSAMVGAGNAMPPTEKCELLDWENKHLGDGTFGTSDWPGWKRYIGKLPTYSDEDRTKDSFGYVYLVRSVSGECKIGRSKDVRRRIQNFATSSPHEFELIHQFPADDSQEAESALHQRFLAKKIKREWYLLNRADVETISNLSAFTTGQFIDRSGNVIKLDRMGYANRPLT